MEQAQKSERKTVFGTYGHKWYNHHKFPLLPVLEYRKADFHNTSGFTFSWLFIRLWSLDAFGFEVALVVDNHWGIGVAAILPYLRIVMGIPLPFKFNMWCQRHLWRKSEWSKQHNC